LILNLVLLTARLLAPDIPGGTASGLDLPNGAHVTFANDSGEPWILGVDRRRGLNGRLKILEFDGSRHAWRTEGNLEPGTEVVLPPGRGIRLAPFPPAYLGFLKTGEDFTGRLYLKDHLRRRIYLDVALPAREGAPAVFSFVPPGCTAKFEGVLAYAFGGGEAEGYAVAHIRIVAGTVGRDGPAPPDHHAGEHEGGRRERAATARSPLVHVSPDPGPAGPEGDPGPGAARPGPPATRP